MFAGIVAKNKRSLLAGISFGLTSGIITTLGVFIGIDVMTSSKQAVFAGIISIAIADSLADAVGIHLAREAEGKYSHLEIWLSSTATFFTKAILTTIFILPLILFDLQGALIVTIALGFILLSLLSLVIAQINKEKPLKPILEHNFVALIVIILTYVASHFISRLIGNI